MVFELKIMSYSYKRTCIHNILKYLNTYLMYLNNANMKLYYCVRYSDTLENLII